MRVFTKVALEFIRYEGNREVEKARTSSLAFSDLPDWVKDDQTFKWALASGDLEVMQTKQDETAAEMSANKKPGKKRTKETE